MYRIGIDVGGTFTDLVAVDEQGRVTLAKAASTPEDQSLGVMDGLDRLAEALSLDRPTLLARTQIVVHGTTVATNALIEHKGARVGLLTTQGHRDIVEMREGLKDDRYNLRQPPPVQLVPRQLRHGVRERKRPDGRTEIALDPASLENAIAALARAGVEAVAVCYLHSWRDDTHERATVEALRAALPDVYVCRSSQVLPQIKEYDRVCTTIVNAYVGPVLERYLTRLASRLGEAGFSGPVLIIQSHGGVSTIADAVRLAAGGVLSGPAGGVAGSRYAARLMQHGDLIPFDMGGTSTDISLIVGGEAAIASDRRLAGQRVALQSLDIASIGAGGGSIARVDAGGVLHVGPQSAGAMPGPPATPGAARKPLSPTPTSSSAFSIPTTSWVVAHASTALPPKLPSIASPPRSASTVWLLPRASIASSTRAWPKASGSSPFGAASIPGDLPSCRSEVPPACT